MNNVALQQGVLYFNNNTNLDMDLFITDYPTIGLNNEIYEEQSIEGHNGSLYVNMGYYKDRKLDFSFDLRGCNIINKLYAVKDWLFNYKDNRLIFNNDKCYLVKKVILTSFKQVAENLAEVEASFIVDPFLYDTEESKFVTTQKNFLIHYGGTCLADTIIKIYGTGDIQITNNGETMQINNVSNYVILDSKCKECVSSTGESKDWDTIGNYIKLDISKNVFELVGNVTKIELTYRNTYL